MTDRNPPPSAADDPATDLYARWMAKLVDVSRRLRWPIVLLALALTVVFAQYTARNLGINSNTTDMLSKDLAFRQVYDKYKAAFPLDASNIVVVVEADSADKADDAALRLSARMAREDKLFSFVFYPEGDPFFRNNGLLYLSQQELNDLSARMADAQPFLGSIAKDPSLRGLFDMLGLALDAAAKGDIKSLALDKVLDRLSDAVEAARDGKRKQISWQEMIGGEDGKGASRRRIIVAQPQVNYGSLTPGKEVMRTIRGYAEALKLTPDTGVRVRLTGSVAINTEELDSVADGVYAASAISLALVAILLVWGLRSITLVVCALLTMLIGLIWTATFAAVSVGSLNLLSVAVAVLFIGIGIDFGVHFTLRYQEQIDRSRPHAEALRRTGAGVGGALTLSGVCAAISFYAFLPTDFRGVAELGLIAGTGMIIGTLLNLTVLPALLSILPLKASRLRIDAEGKPRRNLFHAGEQSVLRNSRAIALGALALGVASIAALPFAQFDRHPLNLKDLTTESMQALADITKDDQNSYFKAGALARDFAEAERLAAELKKLKSVGAVSTILDYIPADQDKKLEIIDDISLLLSPVLETLQPAAKLTPAGRAQALTDFRARLKQILAAAPASALAPRMARLSAALDGFAAARGTSADALAALEEDLIGLFPSRLAALRDSLKAAPVKLADLPSYLQRNNVTEDGRVKIVISPKENLLDNAALRRFVQDIRAVAPEATDSPVVQLESGDAIVAAFRYASIIGFVLITILLLALLRNAIDTALVLSPLILAGLMTGALVVVLGLKFNFANIIVIPLLFGLGVASGIYLVTRARRENTVNLLQTVTARAIMFSALTTVSSFGSLAISSHRGTASMGELLLIAIVLSLLCSLIVLPALLQIVVDRRARRAGRPRHERPSP